MCKKEQRITPLYILLVLQQEMQKVFDTENDDD